jgi:hypothetical protein
LKRKVLIMCVGTQDPLTQNPKTKEEEPGPIVSFMDYLRGIPAYQRFLPDRIYLMATAEKPDAKTSTQRNGEATRQTLGKNNWSEVYLKLLDVLDPSSYHELIPEMRRVTENIIAENPDCEYLINVSPGTGQMEAVWLSFVNSGLIKPKLLQVKAPWVEPEPEKRVVEIDEAPLFESDFIKIAANLLSHYEFKGASDTLLDLGTRTPDPVKTNTAELFSDLANGYSQYENCAFDKAARTLDAVLTNSLFKDSKFSDLHNLALRQKETLDGLAKGVLFESVADLYHRALRRKHTAEYSLCLLFCWDAYERLTTEQARDAIRRQCKLSADYDLPYAFGRFVARNKTKPEVERIFDRLHPGEQDRFDFHYAVRVLDRMQEALAKIIEREQRELDWLAGQRCRTVHEMLLFPVTEQDCERALQLISRIINDTFNSETELSDYPFSHQSFQRISEWTRELI